MKLEQCRWQKETGWENGKEPGGLKEAQLVIFFASKVIFDENGIIEELKNYYPKAEIVGCAVQWQIQGQEVTEAALCFTAIFFEHASVAVVTGSVDDVNKSQELGTSLIQSLPSEGLRHVFVLGDGLNLAGSAFVRGISSKISTLIGLTGGFTSEGVSTGQPGLYCNKKLPKGSAILIGFYGDLLQFSYAANTGWKSYGPIRKITKSDGDTLYELDNKPVLDLYKDFLGPFAHELPDIGLLYPMSVWAPDQEQSSALARTIIDVNEESKSLRTAGDVPEGSNVQFMITNIDMLVKGAETAAEKTFKVLKHTEPELALIMSCISRKFVMKQRSEEELDAVADILGKKVAYVGFYTWGEISPFGFNEKCFFQNQVMAITAIRELDA